MSSIWGKRSLCCPSGECQKSPLTPCRCPICKDLDEHDASDKSADVREVGHSATATITSRTRESLRDYLQPDPDQQEQKSRQTHDPREKAQRHQRSHHRFWMLQ